MFARLEGRVPAKKDLRKTILRDVSRSFYLSLAWLPKEYREPISLAYLLARISDTLADTERVPLKERIRAIELFEVVVREGGTFDGIKEFDCFIECLEDEGERRLLERSSECLQWLNQIDPKLRILIQEVVGKIIVGQRWDITRFFGDKVVVLESEQELMDYTYWVAGCVGEFWTKVGFAVDPGFSNQSEEVMLELGSQYGSALQLINIIRDVEKDQLKGRCYFPLKEKDEDLLDVRRKYIDEVDSLLESGYTYAEHVRPRRVRSATVLPAMIGRETLEKLKNASDEELREGVKISRNSVRKQLLSSFLFSKRS